jgi:cytosine/uracil/thiamine/allantoin permease
MSLADTGRGCMAKLMQIVFIIALIVGLLVFAGKACSSSGSAETNNQTLEDSPIETSDEISKSIFETKYVFAIISVILAIIWFIHALYGIFTGKVLAIIRRIGGVDYYGGNAYVGGFYLISFLIALLMIGFGYMDYKFNDFAGLRFIVEKIIISINKLG